LRAGEQRLVDVRIERSARLDLEQTLLLERAAE
jgi:hypothetical protein